MQYVKQVRYYQAKTDAEKQAAIDQNLNRKIEDASAPWTSSGASPRPRSCRTT